MTLGDTIQVLHGEVVSLFSPSNKQGQAAGVMANVEPGGAGAGPGTKESASGAAVGVAQRWAWLGWTGYICYQTTF